jgi:penicillin-binding protein 2
MKLRLLLPRLLLLSVLAAPVAMWIQPVSLAATIDTPRVNIHKKSRHLRTTHTTHHRTAAYSHTLHSSATVRPASYSYHRRYRRHRYYERFTASSYAQEQTAGDVTAGEDPVVRQAAVAALGDMNGTIVVIDPNNGRILTMVNHHLALSSGAEPCSTIKLSVALAALEEGVITADTPVDLGGHFHMTLTDALAHSNNLYFETVGRRLGFDRVKHYANMFGLGELAGYNIPGEQLGVYPSQVLPESQGGVGRMCSFGESISVTPLQLGALISAIANGGTLYYLQHPETQEQAANFHPMVKRDLNIGPLLPSMTVGMTDVVKFGTGRPVLANFKEFPVLGKTGTCSDNGTRFGWFGSYADTPYGRLAAVIFLEGGRPTYGPKAAELAGIFYHNLEEQNYYATMNPQQPKSEISSIATAR